MNSFKNKGKMLFCNKCRGLCSIIVLSSRDHRGMTALLTGHFLVRPWTAERELLGKQMILFSFLALAQVLCSYIILQPPLIYRTLRKCVKDKPVLKSPFSCNIKDQPESSNVTQPALIYPASKTDILIHLPLLIRIIYP